MRIRTARLWRGRLGSAKAPARCVAIALLAGAVAVTRANEEHVASNSAVKSEKRPSEHAVASNTEVATPARVAATDQGRRRDLTSLAARTDVASADTTSARSETPMERAIRTIAECQSRYERVDDYVCTFYKRERIAGRLMPLHIMSMKVRTKPQSIYFKFQQPAQGREAIYIAGQHGSKILAHDVGLNKILAGTLALEPTSARAMEDCRHPITEAGIGPLLDTLAKRWAVELDAAETKVTFRDDFLVGDRRCTMIESAHPVRRPDFLHHMVRVYIDQELGLPIRFEAFDWGKHPGGEPLLTEEYSYSHLRLNIGLRDIDFDVSNAAYAFGRF